MLATTVSTKMCALIPSLTGPNAASGTLVIRFRS